MKRRYQIEQQRAVQQFRRYATEQNPNIQMVLPLAEVVSLLQQGVGNLLRQAGLALMHLVMDEEVKSLAGERHEQHEGRRAHRWGKEDGYCVVDGQKVPIRRNVPCDVDCIVALRPTKLPPSLGEATHAPAQFSTNSIVSPTFKLSVKLNAAWLPYGLLTTCENKGADGL